MKKIKLSSAIPVWGVLLISAVMGAGELVLWWLCGYAPLLALGLLQLLGATVNLPLLLPLGKEFALRPYVPAEDGKKHTAKKIGNTLANLLRKAANLWHSKWQIVATVLILALLLAANWLFWPNVRTLSDTTRLSYYQPVVLAILFVLSIAVEKWCAHLTAAEGCAARPKAILGNLRGTLMLGRIGQLLTVVVMVLSLVGLFDAQVVLQYLLLAVFLYETVMLLLSLGIRFIRKELSTAPALPLSAKAVGSSNILAYLEENTGITMRSLWSMRLVKQLIPSVLLFVVLLTWFSTGIVQVDSHQEGALYRCGKLQSKTLQPGLHLTLPWPLDKVELYDTQSLRRAVVGYVPNGAEDNTWTEGHGTEEYRLLLGNGNEMISINLQVEYQITDLNRYLQNSASADSLVSASAYEIITARTIATDTTTMLSADRTAFSETFKDELEARIKHYDVGITVTNVILESIHPPVEVASVYQQVVSAGILAEQLLLDAEREAILKKAAATQQALSEKSIASTSQKQAIAAARGEVAQFMASAEAYNGYPGAYTYYKYLAAITESYQKGVLIITGDGVDSGRLVIGDLSRPVYEDPFFIEPEVEEEYYE